MIAFTSALLLIPFASASTSASSPAPIGLIIDTDIGGGGCMDVDDVAAICVGNALADNGEAELLAVVQNTSPESCAGVISVLNTYYGRSDVPIGAFKGQGLDPAAPTLPYVKDLVEGFPSPIKNASQVPSAVDVYRRVLAARKDKSVVVSSIGLLTNLAALFRSGGDEHSPLSGSELFARKVQLLAVMGGKYPGSGSQPECNLCGCAHADPASARTASEASSYVVNNMPPSVKVLFSGFEVGVKVQSGGKLSSCAPATNPARRAFESYEGGPNKSRFSWDPLTTLVAVRGAAAVGCHECTDASCFGTNHVEPSSGENSWVKSSSATNQTYLLLDDAAAASAALDALLCQAPTKAREEEKDDSSSSSSSGGREPGWRVGWGFESHGGFPAVPASWGAKTGEDRSAYSLNASLVGYFLGNASGLDSPDELRAENWFGINGIGWQLDNIPSHYSHLEQYEVEEARALKALNPNAKVMILRNTEVATVFWDVAKTAMDKNPEYWTQCGGKPCVGSWDSPAGNTPKYFFNFSNPALRQWWVETYVMAQLRAYPDLFDGVYFDCSCGAPPGDGLDQQQMQADAQAAFDAAVKTITTTDRGGGRQWWASAWNANGQLDTWNNAAACIKRMDAWLAFTSDPGKDGLTLQVGAPAFNHPVPKNDTATRRLMNMTVAAFQIVRNPSSVLVFPVKGAYGLADSYAWPPELLFKDYGVPLEAGGKKAEGVYTRTWSKAGTIVLDCNEGTAVV